MRGAAGCLMAFWLAVAPGCRRTEIVVVRTPVNVPAPVFDTPVDPQPTHHLALRIGETLPFETFDPLLARNNADFRRLQLVYEGLVRLDPGGHPVAALAQGWTVSPDSLVYTFTLRENATFTDDPSFTTGIGRRVGANDIVFIFRRMASRDVPPTAADLFRDVIVGFDLFDREQRDLYLASLRQTTGINGIQAVDFRTVRFLLNHPDPHFLHRLATPYALVYPMEAVPTLSARPVGSGVMTFHMSHGDTLTQFVRNRAHPDSATIPFRRIEFLTRKNGKDAYRDINLGRTDLIAEAGPEIVASIALIPNDRYDAIPFRSTDHTSLFLNPSNKTRFGRDEAMELFRRALTDSLRAAMLDYGYETQLRGGTQAAIPIGRAPLALLLSPHHHEDILTRLLYTGMRRHVRMTLYTGEAVSRETSLHVRYTPRLIPSDPVIEADELARFLIRGVSLRRSGIGGPSSLPTSWWLDPRHLHSVP